MQRMKPHRFPAHLTILSLATLLWACAPAPESTAPADRHAGEDLHDEDYDEHPGLVSLTPEVIERLGLKIAVVQPGIIEVVVETPGEVQINGDRMAHVAPRVGGVVSSVLVSLGETVRQGQLLAVLESRELADAKATYLADRERVGLAEATFRREERLWRGKISSEQDYLDASNRLAEARISLRAAEQKLHALGIDSDALRRLAEEPESGLTTYRIRAPFTGEIVDRHITVGETIPAETPVFTIADLSTVWVDLRVYPKDLAVIEPGQSVRITPTTDGFEGEGTIRFVQPLLGEDTRTALARVLMPNADRRWKPGLFVTARVTVDAEEADVVVPGTALIRMEDGDDVVFIETGEGFLARKVAVGRRSRDSIEILSGLEPGDRFVADGGFNLKAELGKDSFGDGHGH